MSVARIRKDDIVIAIKGESAGQTGKVLRVMPGKGMAVVEGLNMIKKTMRRSQELPDGAIIEREAPIQLSNLMPYDPSSKKGVKISRVREGDSVIRRSKASGKSLD